MQAQPNADESREDIQKLRAELQELRSMFTSMKSAPSQTPADGKECESLTKRTAAETECESEIAALRKQVKSLQKQMESKKSKVSESPATALRVEHTRQPPSESRQQPSGPSDGNFCYRCGEDRHYSAKCRNADNPTKVIQKLIQALKTAKQSEPSRPTPESGDKVCSAKRSAAVTLKRDIPPGLIGPSSVIPVKING